MLALQRQNKELQEEIHEKELAHAHTGREATRLSQENVLPARYLRHSEGYFGWPGQAEDGAREAS